MSFLLTSFRNSVFIVYLQPYITKTYFGLQNPPVRLAKIVIGDGSLGSDRTNTHMPTVSYLIAYSQMPLICRLTLCFSFR